MTKNDEKGTNCIIFMTLVQDIDSCSKFWLPVSSSKYSINAKTGKISGFYSH